MIKSLTIIIVMVIYCDYLFSQKVITNGSVVIGKDTAALAPSGSIRWTGTDFEGWTGSAWLSLTVPNQIRDLDGNIYHALKIGSQVWLEENLKTTKYNDGTAIPLKELAADWSNAASASAPAYSWYNNDPLNITPYGALYNFYALDSISNGGKNVCPVGWHVPNASEWNTLIAFVGGTAIGGGSLKERGTTHWITPNTGGTNNTGFTALPGGRRGPSGTFASIGSIGYYRTRTADIFPESYYVQLTYNNQNVTNTVWNNGIGMSIRCIRD